MRRRCGGDAAETQGGGVHTCRSMRAANWSILAAPPPPPPPPPPFLGEPTVPPPPPPPDCAANKASTAPDQQVSACLCSPRSRRSTARWFREGSGKVQGREGTPRCSPRSRRSTARWFREGSGKVQGREGTPRCSPRSRRSTVVTRWLHGGYTVESTCQVAPAVGEEERVGRATLSLHERSRVPAEESGSNSAEPIAFEAAAKPRQTSPSH